MNKKVAYILYIVFIIIIYNIDGNVFKKILYKAVSHTSLAINQPIRSGPECNLQTETKFLLYRKTGGAFTQQVSINSLGIRGNANITENKPHQKYRILMTGDSFTYGYGLTNEQTISNMLANELNRQLHESNIEVLNTGLLSYSPDQEYQTLLTNIPRFKPNLIIWDLISWNINDMKKPSELTIGLLCMILIVITN